MRCAAHDAISHSAIIPVSYPCLRFNRLRDSADELIGSMPAQIAPTCLPVDRIQFDMLQIQPGRDPAGKHGLARARSADYSDSHRHARSRNRRIRDNLCRLSLCDTSPRYGFAADQLVSAA